MPDLLVWFFQAALNRVHSKAAHPTLYRLRLLWFAG